LAAEAVERRQPARGSDLEDRAGIEKGIARVVLANTAARGCPVEISVSSLHESGGGLLPIQAVGLVNTETVKCRENARGSDLEDAAVIPVRNRGQRAA
jgi:hypothetical protein